MAAAPGKERGLHCCSPLDVAWRMGMGTHSIAPPGSRGPIHWSSGLAAGEARRLSRPHCYIMGMSGTDIPRSGPGKGQTRVRSLPKPTSMGPVNCD